MTSASSPAGYAAFALSDGPDAVSTPRLPAVVDLPRAAALLGVGRTTAYKLVQENRWPTPVLRLGRLIKVPTKPLLDLLAGGANGPADDSAPTPAGGAAEDRP